MHVYASLFTFLMVISLLISNSNLHMFRRPLYSRKVTSHETTLLQLKATSQNTYDTLTCIFMDAFVFKEILEDVHESLATPDNDAKSVTPSHKLPNRKVVEKSKNAGATFDSIAALTEIMDSSSNVTIPAAGQVARASDPDADTSSTKTEVEEMELDQFSDLEDNLRAHENVSIILE